MRHPSLQALLPALLLAVGATGCAARVEGPSPDLRLRKVVLYQNGIGYFERTGTLPDGRLRLQFRDREVDDVLKSLVVVEGGLDPTREKPSTVSVRLSDRAKTGTACRSAWRRERPSPLRPTSGRHSTLNFREDIARRDAEISGVREVLTDASARAGELRESLRAVEKTPRAAGIQKELLQRLAVATKTIESEAAQLAEKTTAQSIAKGRLGEAVRELRLGDGPATSTP